MTTWLLLTQYNNVDVFDKIWNYCSPKIYFLFDNTALSSFRDEGPLLIGGEINNLVQEYQNNPNSWPGLLIATNKTEDELLLHLRSLLFVTYPPESKGILTYYNPQTAYYFFTYTEPECLDEWLGPIMSISWYGGSWQHKINKQSTWHEFTQSNQCLQTPITEFCLLTQEQQEGLILARQHKYIYDKIYNNQNASFEQTYKYMQEAIGLGFNDIEHLNQYLTLRSQYSYETLSQELWGNNSTERVQNLKSFLNKNR